MAESSTSRSRRTDQGKALEAERPANLPAALPVELDLHDVVFVGHSVSAMIGVLAVNREPARFAALVLLTPSPRYIDDTDYRGGFSRADIDELLESLDSNYLGWSATMAPVIMGNPDRPELGAELTNSFCRTDPTIARQAMDNKLAEPTNTDLYRKRQHSIEPVFGNIKANLGYRRFARRGLPAVNSEWRLICASHNMLKLRQARPA